jgi:hypothetical protein
MTAANRPRTLREDAKERSGAAAGLDEGTGVNWFAV